MTEPVAPIPSDTAPWTVRLAYWYIGRRETAPVKTVGYRGPHLSRADARTYLYPPMAADPLASSYID